MTAIAALVTHLLSCGISADAVAHAVDLAQQHAIESAEIRGMSAENPRMAAYERRLEKDRERKRSKRTADASADFRGSSTDDASILTSLSSFDSQEKKDGVVGKAKAARGSRLPADWQPSQADLNFAVCHLSESRISQEIEKFRDYWHARAGPGGVKLDWAATWRTWIRKAAEQHGKSNGKPNELASAFDELRLELGGEVDGGQGGPPMRDVTPGRAQAR